MTRAEQEAQVCLVERRCRGPLWPPEVRFEVNRLLAVGELDLAARLDNSSRRPCGQDVNALIIQNPFDGEEKTVACPRCHTQISYRAPRFED